MDLYLAMLPVTAIEGEEEIEYPYMLPLWYYAMVRWGVNFQQAVVAIRTGKVTMAISPNRPASAASKALVRAGADELDRTEWKGNMTNPDTMVFCRLGDSGRGLESLDVISSGLLMVVGPMALGVKDGLLTGAQYDGLPPLYRSVLDRDELPALMFSDAAAEWFDAD